MSEKGKLPDKTSVTIKGNVSGQIGIGNNISQSQTEIHNVATAADLNDLRQALHDLRAKVEAEAPAEKKAAALERVQELEQAITEKEPDLSTMEYVKNWFGKNIPTLAGAIASIVVHPIVGKLVEAGGDLLVEDFQHRFGSKD
jgi:hypothetical protein